MKKRLYTTTVAFFLAAVLVGIFLWASRPSAVRNIILISIDTCRADYLSCYGYPQKTTPHIDSVAENATRFEHVVSPVPITLPAHSSMLTGTIPPFHGVHNNIGYQLASSNQTLPEILKKNGFNTAAIVSAFVLDKRLGLAQGFDTYHDTFKDVHHNKFGNERKGDETTQVALDWLDKNKDNKSFLFLHYYDPHIEYMPPEPFASAFADNPYAGEIAFTDHCIGRVIQKLKDLKMYDSSLLIITGDHGEMLGEHGEEEHTYFIYESAIRVPLIVKLPGQKKSATITHLVGLVDIVPTICSMLDINIPSQIQGQDILSLLQGKIPDAYERFIYSESVTPTRINASSLMAISTGKWKYIQAPRPELYDITSDPGEEHNLIEIEPHRARVLEDRLREMLEQSVRKNTDNRIELDAESIKRLESLGYVAGKAEGEIAFDGKKDDPKDLIHFFVQFQEALTLFERKEFKKAKKTINSLVLQRPEFFELYLHLGDIAMLQDKFDRAIVHYRRVVQMEPNQDQALNNLAWIQATRPSLAFRDVDEALKLAKQLCKLSNFSDPNALDTLSVAYAACGDFPKAAATARKAHALTVSANNTIFAKKIVVRLKLFEQSKPYIEE